MSQAPAEESVPHVRCAPFAFLHASVCAPYARSPASAVKRCDQGSVRLSMPVKSSVSSPLHWRRIQAIKPPPTSTRSRALQRVTET